MGNTQLTRACYGGYLATRARTDWNEEKLKPRKHARLLVFIWSRAQDLNPQPADYKSAALPIELARRGKLDFSPHVG